MNLLTVLRHPFVLLVTFFIGFAFIYRNAPPLSLSLVTTQKPEPFAVTGEGSVTAVPDEVELMLGFEKFNPKLRPVQDEMHQAINGVTEELKKLQIDAKDIITTSYSVQPEYDYSLSGGRPRVVGYRASAQITVKIKRFEILDEVVDRATAQGANMVGQLQFRVNEDRREELLKEARGIAIMKAKEKAQTLARATGMSLDRIISVSESPYYRQPAYYGRTIQLGTVEKELEPVQIEPGSTEIRTSVTLYYETK